MILFVADVYAEQYAGGAELTTEALLNSSFWPIGKAMSSRMNLKTMKQYKDAVWIFGNFSELSSDCLLYAIQNLKYFVLEYDYKYCKYRSPEKHIEAEKECGCEKDPRGKIVAMFLNGSAMTWWMSLEQKQRYQEIFSFLKDENNKVLSSVFSNETLEYINSLDTTKKTEKWVIMNSDSWIKGVDDAVEYAKKNDLEYELLWGLEHKDFLKKLAESKGLIFFPKAGDTCPRMVLEAKLLDCELILNDNVQHKDEEWFSTKESTLSYLKQRTKVFWDTLEELGRESLQLPEKATGETRFQIIVPFYNAEKYLAKCIRSIKSQRHQNFVCTLIDDMSTDMSCGVVSHLIADDDRFQLIKNKKKKYALSNIVTSIEQNKCLDEDVVILLDGDDWFASTRSLDKLCDTYENTDCLLTYGSYVIYPWGVRGPEPSKYPDEIIENNSYRKDEWRASHLRTFKYKLWKHLNHDDLKDEEGKFYEMTYDQAIMLPLLEMSGPRAKYISEILHVYNKENPLNIDKSKAEQQISIAREIRQKKPYKRL